MSSFGALCHPIPNVCLQFCVLHAISPVVLYRHGFQRVEERVVVQTVKLIRIVLQKQSRLGCAQSFRTKFTHPYAVVDISTRIRFAQRLWLVKEPSPVDIDKHDAER